MLVVVVGCLMACVVCWSLLFAVFNDRWCVMFVLCGLMSVVCCCCWLLGIGGCSCCLLWRVEMVVCCSLLFVCCLLIGAV